MPVSSPTDFIAPEIVHREAIKRFGEKNHAALQRSRRRNGYFHRYLTRVIRHNILPGSRVLDIGCAAGNMLAAMEPSYGVGIDINAEAIAQARKDFPHLTFHEMAAEDVNKLGGGGETFDYIILS